MVNTLPAVIKTALHGSESKSLASRFSSGRFDKEMKWAAERQFAEQAIAKNEDLQKCSPESIQGALLDVAYTGLSLSPTMAHAYLIPYGITCSFAPGYRGLLHMAFKAGTVRSVQVNLVYQNDAEFKVWSDENGRHLIHVENARGTRGSVTHAYCIAHLTSMAPPLIEVMNHEQIAAVERAATKRNKGGMVWKSAFRDEMCKKAVIRRASKLWPKDDGGILQHMANVVDRFDPMEFEQDRDSPPPEAELCMNADQATELNDLLVNRGITAHDAPEWIRRWAQSKGYGSIDDTPARLFTEAKETLTKRLDERSAEK